MKKYFIMVLFFFVSISFSFAQLSMAQMWAISLAGIVTEWNRSNRNSLSLRVMDERSRTIWMNGAMRTFGVSNNITNREELLDTLENIEHSGHAASFGEIRDIVDEVKNAQNGMEAVEIISRFQWDDEKYNRYLYVSENWDRYHNRTIRAWDLGRNISLCRWGYSSGYLTEDEAWEKIFHYARIIQSIYNSWEEYGNDYMMGSLFWASGSRSAERIFSYLDPTYNDLFNSYWSWFDWFVDLDQGETEVPPINTIRFLEPKDNDGAAQFLTNDPLYYNRFPWATLENPNPNPNVYECTVKKISGCSRYGYGILFCVDDSDSNNVSYYRLFISTRGQFALAKIYENTGAADGISWRNNSSINSGFGAYNNIRVERTDNANGAAFRIFFNNRFAAEFNDPNPLNGTKAGLVVSVNVMEMEQFPYVPVDVRFYFK